MIREALKEELLAEFNAIPPLEELQKMYSFSERHVRQMEEIFAELRKREQKEQYWYKVRKVAIIVIAVLAAVFASVKFVPEVYAYVKEWLMETKEDRIRFQGKSTGESSGEANGELRFELGYIPDGYELEEEVHSKVGSHIISYSHQDEVTLTFMYRGKTDANLVALNTEGILVDETIVNGIQYYVFESDNTRTIVTWEYGTYVMKIEGLLDKFQMLDIATSVK